MGQRIFAAAYTPGSTVPLIASLPFDQETTEEIRQGSVVIFDAGEVAEAADLVETGIVGITAEPTQTKPGWFPANSPQVIETTGRVNQVDVFLAKSNTVFSGAASSTLSQANVGVKYGITTGSAAHDWWIDLAETTDVAVIIVDVDVDNQIAFFQFIPSAIIGA